MTRTVLFWMSFLLSSVAWSKTPGPNEGADHSVRFQTHFHQPLLENGLGMAGWVVLPDVIKLSTSTLFLIGPRYDGQGWWLEGMAGGLMTPGDPTSHPWVLSGRFEFSPRALNAPLRLWANLQLNDVTGGTFQPYALVALNVALLEEKIFLGIESENYLNKPMDDASTQPINDFSVGPQLMLPFGGLQVTTALQIHPHEAVRDQYWLRVMYDFGPIEKTP